MSEIWKPVPGFERFYEASDRGRVRSLNRVDSLGRTRTGRILSPWMNSGGYLYVNLVVNGSMRHHAVHRLVLTSFVGEPAPGFEGCHGNGVKTDNSLANLRWGTSAENKRDVQIHGRYVNPSSTKTHCPRGHLLKAPNLMPSQERKGHRICLACNRAKAICRYRGVPFTQAIADQYYSQISGKRVPHE